MFHIVLQSLSELADPVTILAILLASFYGLFVGAIPGLTATLATALLVPIAFLLDPVPALATIVTMQAMAIFAGDIPAALVRMPGTPATAAYTEDSHALSLQGKVHLVFGIDVLGSALGGVMGAIALIVGAPLLMEFALQFTSFEYFWLALLGLSTAAFIATESPVKGMLSVLIGLFLSTIGIDITLGFPRFTFGSSNLLGGISFIPAMIGLFGLAEVLRNVLRGEMHTSLARLEHKAMLRPALPILWRYRVNMVRGGVIGLLVGALPGAGADIAAWLAYGAAKKFSKAPEQFGKGALEPLVDAGVANNSALAGAWIPALVFGIPGDSVTAIVIGILMLKGLRPGPVIFQQYTDVLVSIYITFILANLLMIPMGYLAIRASSHVLRVPRNILMPAILLMCIVGAYAINNSAFDIGLMLVMGILGFLLESYGFPVAPIVLGLVLGPILEQNFMISLIKSQWGLSPFFLRPVSAILGGITLLVWILPLLPLCKKLLRFQE
ncbi:MAG: C4-dicarboxylate ABC transporter permease [Nitrospinota bacterium]|nr:MAG: C4-dicarboxylate ABC transporter permease [Nitrospinota bacterium]